MNKDLKIYLILVVIVVLIILGIFYLKNLFKENLDEKTAECIAKNATLFSQTSCSHCIAQKQIIGEYIKLFRVIECDKEQEPCQEAEITGTPTWIINGKKVEGTQSISKLKELAGC